MDNRLRDYLKLSDIASVHLADGIQFPYWWACANSARNRFTSSVLPEFGNVSLVSVNKFPGRWMAGRVRETWCWFFRIRNVKKIWNGSGIEMPRSNWVAIKSFGYQSSFDNGIFKDPFFGEIAKEIERTLGVSTITIVDGLPDSVTFSCFLKQSNASTVIPIELFLDRSDVFRALGRMLLAGLVLNNRLAKWCRESPDENLERFRSIVKREGWRVSLSDLIFWYAGKRLSRSKGLRAVLLTHEANMWERMFIAGIRSGSDARILGYQHSVVPPAAAGVFETASELENAPVPDVVFTTGDYTRDLILRFGNRSSEAVISTCALRYAYLYSGQRSEGKGVVKRLLVALEGLPAAIDLVKYTLREAGSVPGWEILIRTHPVLPWEEMAKQLELMEIPENVVISRQRTLQQDLEESAVVMYWGSTVALEALMFGIPVIHFNRGDAISLDPLFELESFRWEVSSDSPLDETLHGIKQLSPVAAEIQRQNAQHFVRNYLINPTSDRMETILGPIRAALGQGRPASSEGLRGAEKG